jgi:hypothetical protein
VLANVARLWRGDREGRSRGVQAPRPARSAALPAREPGMTRPLLAGLLVALLSAMPAAADHCSPGQFYRVRLNQCVGLNTRLASAYVHAAASRSATPGREIRLRFPSSPRRNLSASPRLSSRSSCRRSMTGRRQNSHGGRTAALEEMAGERQWRSFTGYRDMGPQHAQSRPPHFGPRARLRRWGRSTVSVR